MTEKRKYPIAGTDFFTQIMDDDGYYIDKTDVIPGFWLERNESSSSRARAGLANRR